jgi:hypothetical protein
MVLQIIRNLETSVNKSDYLTAQTPNHLSLPEGVKCPNYTKYMGRKMREAHVTPQSSCEIGQRMIQRHAGRANSGLLSLFTMT